jgi:hypothetical protein
MCGADIPTKGTGRPPSYCSTGCRRAAENERARLSRHLERLEEKLIAMHLRIPSHVNRSELRALEREIARLTTLMIERCAA